MMFDKMKWIKLHKSLSRFNRAYDNTVVDTYAFGCVIQSNELTNFVMKKLTSKLTLEEVCEQTCDFILKRVNDIYSKTHHEVVGQDVYLAYTIDLMTETLLYRST